MDLASAFFLLGSFQLLRLCFQDMKERWLDLAPSMFMNGVITLMFLLTGHVLDGLIVMLVLLFGLGVIKNQKWITGLSDGDITVLAWVLAGFWVLGWVYMAFFLGFYIIGILALHRLKIEKIPVLVPVTVSFILVWILQLLWLK